MIGIIGLESMSNWAMVCSCEKTSSLIRFASSITSTEVCFLCDISVSIPLIVFITVAIDGLLHYSSSAIHICLNISKGEPVDAMTEMSL